MKAPNSIKKADDILYAGDGELTRERIEAIIADYEPEDGRIRAIQYDGPAYGAWVNASCWDIGGQYYRYQWLYIAAGDRDNRQMTAQAAGR